MHWRAQLYFHGRRPLRNLHNIRVVLENDHQYKGLVGYNRRLSAVEILKCPPWEDDFCKNTLLSKDFLSALKSHFDYNWFEVSLSKLDSAVRCVAYANSFDRVKNYLSKLEWDGSRRIHNWISRYTDVEDSPYSQNVSFSTMIALIERAHGKGSFQGMPIFCPRIPGGNQGHRLISAMAGRFGREYLGPFGNTKRMLSEFGEAWIIEVNDVHKFNNKKLQSMRFNLKARSDRIINRNSFSLYEDRSRKCVLWGTTADFGRICEQNYSALCWPLYIGDLDEEALKRDRNQLIAEAKYIYETGYPEFHYDFEVPIWGTLGKDGIAAHKIRKWLAQGGCWGEVTKHTSIKELWKYALGKSDEFLPRNLEMEIAKVLRDLGCTRKKVWKKGRSLNMWLCDHLIEG